MPRSAVYFAVGSARRAVLARPGAVYLIVDSEAQVRAIERNYHTRIRGPLVLYRDDLEAILQAIRGLPVDEARRRHAIACYKTEGHELDSVDELAQIEPSDWLPLRLWSPKLMFTIERYDEVTIHRTGDDVLVRGAETKIKTILDQARPQASPSLPFSWVPGILSAVSGGLVLVLLYFDLSGRLSVPAPILLFLAAVCGLTELARRLQPPAPVPPSGIRILLTTRADGERTLASPSPALSKFWQDLLVRIISGLVLLAAGWYLRGLTQ